MSAVVIRFPGKPETEQQPNRRKLTKAQIAERVYHLTWVARDLGLAITIHGPIGEAQQ